ADLKALYAEPFFFKAVQVDDSPTILALFKQEREPQVLARFETRGRSIFLVSRQIGQGKVLFCSTGLLSSWNTLPKTNAILMFDRLLRQMIQNTLPERNLAPTDQLMLALPNAEPNQAVSLSRPGQMTEEPLEMSYVGAQQRGVVLSRLLQRGVYWVRGWRPTASPNVAA